MITNNGKAFAESTVKYNSGSGYFYKFERKTNIVSIDGSSVSPDTYNATPSVSNSSANDALYLGYGTAAITNLTFGVPNLSITRYPVNPYGYNSIRIIHYSFGYQSEDVSEETYSVDRSYTDTYSEGQSVAYAHGNVIFTITNLTTEQKTINTFGIYAFLNRTFVSSSTSPKTETTKYFLLYAEKFDDVTIQPGETYQFTLKRNLE